MIAWELGGNYGHIARCLPIAKALRSRGHEVMLVVRDLRTAAEMLAADGLAYCQAPVSQCRAIPRCPPTSYAEILLGGGYQEANVLLGMTQAWKTLLELHGSSVLLADHSPTALLAAHLMAIPKVAIGNGFAIPPDQSPLPSIRPWDDVSTQRLQQADQRLQQNLDTLATRFGVTQPISLQALFGQSSLLDTFPELDHFGAREHGQYIGPIFGISNGLHATWQNPEARKILLYVRPEIAGFKILMSALADIDAEKICVIPGLSPKAARQLANRQTRISLKPLALGALLKEADLMICQAGGGTMNEALLAGVPLLGVPAHVEQYWAAQRVEQLGAGMSMGTDRNQDTFKRMIKTLIETPSFRRGAQAFSRAHEGFHPDQAVVATVNVLETLMARDYSQRKLH